MSVALPTLVTAASLVSGFLGGLYIVNWTKCHRQFELYEDATSVVGTVYLSYKAGQVLSYALTFVV